MYLMGLLMDFERCAGGHNFDFDTDVCTRCGIGRRQYRNADHPRCTARKSVPIGDPTSLHVVGPHPLSGVGTSNVLTVSPQPNGSARHR
jgi:hypothetical protein